MKVFPRQGSVWKHFKGTEYVVLYNAYDSETAQPCVVYSKACINKKYQDRKVWVRPLSEWYDHIDRETYTGPRFTELNK